MADNPFVEGCSKPIGVLKRVLIVIPIAIVVALVLFILEHNVFHQDDIVTGIVTGIGTLFVAALSFVMLGGLRNHCDFRDTFDFYTKQGAPPNVAKALTMQKSHTEITYYYAMLIWFYLLSRLK